VKFGPCESNPEGTLAWAKLLSRGTLGRAVLWVGFTGANASRRLETMVMTIAQDNFYSNYKYKDAEAGFYTCQLLLYCDRRISFPPT